MIQATPENMTLAPKLYPKYVLRKCDWIHYTVDMKDGKRIAKCFEVWCMPSMFTASFVKTPHDVSSVFFQQGM